jgi:S-DNA-T family DNA segregation ATPase FtsK/SpoIIIE
MYLVIATQRPSVDVITGVIKANVPSRISFAVSSQVDSRTILDSMGAEKLLGKGDMLYAARGAIKPIRIQGNFISDGEIERVIDFVKKQFEAEYDESIIEQIEREQENRDSGSGDEDSHTRSGDKDELFVKAAELVFESGQASVAMLQRKYKVGYQRAARIIDQLEENHIIGPYEGTKPRQVLITRSELNEMLMNNTE